MEVASEAKWLGIKPYLFRIFSGFIALWSANQIAYAIIASTTAFPAAAADRLLLLYPAYEAGYQTSLVFYSVMAVIFGIGAITPSRTLIRVEEWWEVHRERPTWIAGVFLYVGLALAILLYFWVTNTAPRYQTYVDPDGDSVIRRHTHLLRPGVDHQTIPFSEIKEIVFRMDPTAGAASSYVSLVLEDDRAVEVGRTTGDYTEGDLVELGKQLSQYSGLPFEEPDLPALN